MPLHDHIDSIPVTQIRSIKDHYGKILELGQIIQIIKEGSRLVSETQALMRQTKEEEAKKALKQTLPAFSLGKYDGGYISSSKCLKSFGMIIDIDNLEPSKFDETFTQVKSIPEVYVAFRSPSGYGIKAILLFEIPLDSALTGANSLSDFYRGVYRFYSQKLFRMENLDAKTCDICRLCFFAHDPDIYVNTKPNFLDVAKDKAAITAFNEIPSKPVSVCSPIPCGNGQDFTDEPLTEDLKARITEASKYLSDLSEPDWFRVALALRPYGEFGWQTFLALSLSGSKYKDSEQEIRKKFDSAGSRSKTGKKATLGTLFYLAKENGWNDSNPIFWSISEPEDEDRPPKVSFPPCLVVPFLSSFGFHRLQSSDTDKTYFIQVKENIVHEKTHEEIVDFLRHYIEEKANPSDKKSILDSFLNAHDKFAKKSLFKNLDLLELNFVMDTKDRAFFFFSDCWVQVSVKGVEQNPYRLLPGHIFSDQIQKRSFSKVDFHGDFEKFIQNVTKHENPEISKKRFDSIRSVLGGLTHGYNTWDCAIIFTDERFSEDLTEANGGTGKSLIANSLQHLRPLVSIDGKKWKGSERFSYQSLKALTKIVHFNDLNLNFKLDEIFNALTDKVSIENKNRTPFDLNGVDRPKFILSTNYNIKGHGSSYNRRMYTVELNQHYNEKHFPKHDFEKRFFQDWEENDWNQFYSFYFDCLQFYFQNGLVEEVKINSDMKKVQAQVGEMFFGYFNKDRIAEIVFRSNKGNGLKIEDLFQEYLLANPRGTEKLLAQTFSRNLNLLMEFYKVQVEHKRPTVNRSKETWYVYKTSFSTNTDVQIALNEMNPTKKLKGDLQSDRDDDPMFSMAA